MSSRQLQTWMSPGPGSWRGAGTCLTEEPTEGPTDHLGESRELGLELDAVVVVAVEEPVQGEGVFQVVHESRAARGRGLDPHLLEHRPGVGPPDPARIAEMLELSADDWLENFAVAGELVAEVLGIAPDGMAVGVQLDPHPAPIESHELLGGEEVK